MIKGYARVSTNEQDLETQLEKLNNAGASEIFKEKSTGTKTDGRKELKKLLDNLEKGDIVLITKIDRLARSITDLRELVNQINKKGADVQFLDNNLMFKAETKDTMATLMLNMLGSFAEFERDLIVSRTQEGKAHAKANNPNFREGRPRRRLTKQYLHAIELCKTHSKREVSEITGFSVSTLHNITRQARAEGLLKD